MKFSNRINNIEASQSVAMVQTITKLRSQGHDIISLNVGETSFVTPAPIIQATKKALDDNNTRYCSVQGNPVLLDKIAKYLNTKYDFDIATENIILGAGSKQILYNVFQTIVNEGDEVIVPTPYWVSFPESIRLAGGVPVFVGCHQDHQLDITAIEKSITKKTKAIIINNPNNPTGAIYDDNDLKLLIQIALKYDLYIVSDEAYEGLIYEEEKFNPVHSICTNKLEKSKVLTVQSFSKSFCMTGFRIGYLVADEKFIQGVYKLQSHLMGNLCSFAQNGAIAALDLENHFVDSMLDQLKKQRDLGHKLFAGLFDCSYPHGALYLYLNVKKYYNESIKTSADFAEYILKNAHVALLPSEYFGGQDYVRLSFATSEDDLQQAFERIKLLLL